MDSAAIPGVRISDAASIDTLRDVLAESETEIGEAGSAARNIIRAKRSAVSYSFSIFVSRKFRVNHGEIVFRIFAKSNENQRVSMRRARNSRKVARDRSNGGPF